MGARSRKLLCEFPDKGCKLGSIDSLLEKIRKMVTIDQATCQREHWECRRPCAQSGRQSKIDYSNAFDMVSHPFHRSA